MTKGGKHEELIWFRNLQKKYQAGAASLILPEQIIDIRRRCELRRAERLDRFFFQAEYVIRNTSVTGVQTCALPISHDAILKALVSVRGTQRITDQNPETKYQALERYAHDLTESARQGKLDPVIGRDEEIRRVMQVLSRRTKNNPVLIGEPGVG